MPNSLEILRWGDEDLEISTYPDQRIIHPSPVYGDIVELPLTAEVVCRPSTEGWGGHEGTTYFVEQTPAAHVSGWRGSKPFDASDSALMGRMASLDPDGTFYPPQLSEILRYVQEKWGWEVNPDVLDRLEATRKP